MNYISETQQANNYSWDDRGNMISDQTKKLSDTKYDWRDMPVRFTLQDSGTWNATVDMVYDASGNRVLKKDKVEEDGVVTRAKAVAYVYNDMVFKNDDFEVEEYELQYYNIYGEGRKNHSSGTNNYYLKDHLGSTRLVVDNEGEWNEATMYDSYGKMEQIAFGGDADKTREKFTGKEFDEEGAVEGRTNGLGLFYFGSRFYDPEIGKWITPDKAQQFFDAYSYTGNRPIGYIDSDGDIAFAIVVIGAVAGAAINAYIAHSKGKPVGKAMAVGGLIGGASAGVAVLGAAAVGVGAGAIGIGEGVVATAVGAGKAIVGGALGGGVGAFGYGWANTGSIGEGLSAVPGGVGAGAALGLASFGLAAGIGFPGTISEGAMELTAILSGQIFNAVEAVVSVAGGKSSGKGTGGSNNGDPSPTSPSPEGPQQTTPDAEVEPSDSPKSTDVESDSDSDQGDTDVSIESTSDTYIIHGKEVEIIRSKEKPKPIPSAPAPAPSAPAPAPSPGTSPGTGL